MKTKRHPETPKWIQDAALRLTDTDPLLKPHTRKNLLKFYRETIMEFWQKHQEEQNAEPTT